MSLFVLSNIKDLYILFDMFDMFDIIQSVGDAASGGFTGLDVAVDGCSSGYALKGIYTYI